MRLRLGGGTFCSTVGGCKGEGGGCLLQPQLRGGGMSLVGEEEENSVEKIFRLRTIIFLNLYMLADHKKI